MHVDSAQRDVRRLSHSLLNCQWAMMVWELAYHKRMKPLDADVINSMPTNETTIDFFKKLMLTEMNEDAVAGASLYFLDSLNIADTMQQDRAVYDCLLDELRSDDTAAKLRAVAQAESAAGLGGVIKTKRLWRQRTLPSGAATIDRYNRVAKNIGILLRIGNITGYVVYRRCSILARPGKLGLLMLLFNRTKNSLQSHQMKIFHSSEDPETAKVQAMRLRRVKFGSVSYLVTFSLVALFGKLGYFGVDVVLTFCVLALVINVVFYALIGTGYNLRLADPSMTMAQICVSIIPALYVMYYAQQLRGVFLLLCVSSALYGLFRFRTRDFAIMTFFVLGGYALLIAMVYVNRPHEITLQVEIVQLFALFATLLQFSGLGTFIANLRDKVRDKNKELRLRNSELEHALLRIEELAMRDELTGVFNRRYLMDVMRSEKHRCERNGGTFSICILDVDHFKNVNDTYGHGAGDEVLKAIAGSAGHALRQTDYFGRYGGEEFALLLPATSVEEALVTAERIRTDIEALRFPDISPDLKVSASIGIASSGGGEDLAHTLQRADQALYRAKATGRNRCLSAV